MKGMITKYLMKYYFYDSSCLLFKWKKEKREEKGGKIMFWVISKENCYCKTLLQYLKDKFWASYCNFFYVHTTLGTTNHDRSIAGSVHQNCKVCFPGNIQRFCNHHLKMDRGKKRKHQWFWLVLLLCLKMQQFDTCYSEKKHWFHCFYYSTTTLGPFSQEMLSP